jgi:hypothetical protein
MILELKEKGGGNLVKVFQDIKTSIFVSGSPKKPLTDIELSRTIIFPNNFLF